MNFLPALLRACSTLFLLCLLRWLPDPNAAPMSRAEMGGVGTRGGGGRLRTPRRLCGCCGCCCGGCGRRTAGNRTLVGGGEVCLQVLTIL